MANTIKLKRGSGSDPSASDLAVGEVALRTDTAKLFTKNDAGNVAEIGSGLSDGDKGDITVSNSGATFTIDNGVVTGAKIADSTITNQDINSSAAIAGTKISPDFGSQNVDTTGNILLDSNSNKLKIGDGEELQISHNGSQSIITDTAHPVFLKGNQVHLQSANGNMVSCYQDAQTELFFNENKKLATASGGIDVTGNISVSGTVDGRDLATDGTKLDGIESNATADQTAAEIKTLLNSNQLEAAQIASNAVTEAKIATNAVTRNKISDGEVISSKLDSSAVTTSKINDNAVTTAKLSNDSVTAAKIAANAVGSSELANDSVGSNALANNAVDTAAIQDDAVTYAKIQNVSATNRILGRDSSGAGVIEEITPANLRTMINVEDGATADQSASEILTLIKTVDGSGSGLDADTLDGVSSGSFARSDANDTLSGVITLSSTSRDCLNFSGSSSDDNRGIAFNGRIAMSADNSDGYLRLNNANEFSNGVYTPSVMRADSGFKVGGTTVISSSGQIIAAQVPTLNQNTTGTAATVTGATQSNITSVGTLTSINTSGELNFTGNGNKQIDFATLAGSNTITLRHQNGGSFETAASFTANGGAAITHNGSTKIATTGAGIEITGNARTSIVTVSDASNITIPLNTGSHFTVTLGGNRTFINSNMQTSDANGASGSIFIVQDGTGNRTAAFQSNYKFAGGTAPTLSTAANAVDRLDYVVRANNNVHCVVTLDVK